MTMQEKDIKREDLRKRGAMVSGSEVQIVRLSAGQDLWWLV